ncbi:TonB-dependent receptor plug domain-containing protein [Tunicatimonas pelagia]|uniref:TonB-dependent receptor plug domain-containing protein n=1 Tax=Tunicatimonas pelagia TaxID=931531 RepID=UPI002665013D|nr:TonB-dependent receptor plug domain-containing protein [Tunicatimonas pelagia]WKN40778.1 TonB-dependent receptor plug domain-containing protein [Tunicatimonas pelagia]
MNLSRILGAFLLALVIVLGMQSPPDKSLSQQINEQLTTYVNTFRQEKIYIHFDKPYYSAGESIWFKTYLVDAALHSPQSLSGLAYVELIDPSGNIISHRNLEVSESGAAGDFFLSDTLPVGSYTVRAYTNWMRNFDEAYFFQKSIPVGSIDSTALAETVRQEEQVEQESFVFQQDQPPIDLQFFPEGGQLVNELTSIVAFKATGPDGRGLAVQGRIVDQHQQPVTTFKSQQFGMGRFILKPSASCTYQAEIEIAGVPLTFPLPEAQEYGYIMRSSPRHFSENIKIAIESHGNEGVKDGVLIGHQRGIPFISIIVEANKPYFIAEIPKSTFPNGICHLTFFDKIGAPQCERLIFVNYPTNLPKLSIKSSQPRYATRQKATLRLSLADENQQPLPAFASLTVTNPNQVSYSDGEETIVSNLLLTSDLRGTIEQPQHYFTNRTQESYQALNNLMLTQGWRRFVWNDVLRDTLAPAEYMVERGFQIKGQMVRYYSRDQPVSGPITMMTVDSSFFVAEGKTNESGQFTFVDNQFQDTTELVIQARRVKGRKEKLKKDVFIKLELPTKPPVEQARSPDQSAWLSMMGNYLEQQQKINQIDEAYNFDEKVIILDEVEIEGRKDDFNDPFRDANRLYSEPDNRIILDSIPGGASALSIFDLLRRVPGVQVFGAFPNETAVIRGITSFRGSNEAFYLLDGIPTDAELINTINVNDVYYIDVLKGPAAAIFGSRGAGGAIAVYTRRGAGVPVVTERLGITNITHPGYYQAREFYTPRYNTKKSEHVKPDFRSTLHWEPTLVFDEEGTAQVEFYTSDEKAEFDVRVEGITTSGKPFAQQHSLVVD